MQALTAEPNAFRGIVIKPSNLPVDPGVFRERLGHSLNVWEAEGYQVVWMETPIQQAALIPVAVEAGFVFHHSTDDYLMLTRRLKPDAFIPNHATHYVGAGGVVLNDRQEVLVVCERFRGKDRPPYYKLPGGALHPAEHLTDGVIREVFEETGVPTRFQTLVCLRHWHGYRYGKSDIYFVCRLEPLHQIIKMQATEIEACFWMPVRDYFRSEHVSAFNKKIVNAAIEHPGFRPTWVEGYGDPNRYEFFMPGDPDVAAPDKRE